MSNKSEYKSVNEWRIKNPGAYESAKKKGIIEQMCVAFGWDLPKTKKHNFWNEFNVANEAKKYNSRKEFELGSRGAYKYANKHGIIDEVCSHMEKVFNSYTEESIHAEAKKYKTILEFRNKAGKFYQAASKRKIIHTVCSHMKLDKKPYGYWNSKQNCIEACKLCRNISDIENKYPAAYKSIKKNKWDEEMEKYYFD